MTRLLNYGTLTDKNTDKYELMQNNILAGIDLNVPYF